MPETDALAGAKFNSSLYVKEFPVKLRVMTLDPMVYNDNRFANTHFVFIVYNVDEDKAQLLDTTGGNAQRLQEIHLDEDLGNNLRRITIKITTNGKSGIERRYTINTIGEASDLTKEQVATLKEANLNLEEIVHKNNPNAMRLSEINAGGKLPVTQVDDDIKPSDTQKDISIEDLGGEEIDVNDIPF